MRIEYTQKQYEAELERLKSGEQKAPSYMFCKMFENKVGKALE